MERETEPSGFSVRVPLATAPEAWSAVRPNAMICEMAAMDCWGLARRAWPMRSVRSSSWSNWLEEKARSSAVRSKMARPGEGGGSSGLVTRRL